jgi:NAD(P)-dependent dehydrogenase (short-subunit alcohol dehydrogenase family)
MHHDDRILKEDVIMKTALITGATDGIGKALAISLAKKGYAIHVLGRNAAKGKKVIEVLSELNPTAEHKLFIVDLSSINANHGFLDDYLKRFKSLDLLVLNANPWPGKLKIAEEGHDKTFGVGYLSRYMFSVKLNSMLSKTPNSGVMHIGDARMMTKIKFDEIQKPNYSGTKALFMSFTGSAYIVYFFGKQKITSVPHEFMNPGLTATNQKKPQSKFLIKLSRMFGLWQPTEVGELLGDHIEKTDRQDCNMMFFDRDIESKLDQRVSKHENEFTKLLALSEIMTGCLIKDI